MLCYAITTAIIIGTKTYSFVCVCVCWLVREFCEARTFFPFSIAPLPLLTVLSVPRYHCYFPPTSYLRTHLLTCPSYLLPQKEREGKIVPGCNSSVQYSSNCLIWGNTFFFRLVLLRPNRNMISVFRKFR